MSFVYVLAFSSISLKDAYLRYVQTTSGLAATITTICESVIVVSIDETGQANWHQFQGRVFRLLFDDWEKTWCEGEELAKNEIDVLEKAGSRYIRLFEINGSYVVSSILTE